MKQAKSYTVGHRRRAEQHCLLVFRSSTLLCVCSVAWVEKALQKFAHQKFKMHPRPFADKSEAKTLRSSIKGIASCWWLFLYFFICEHKRYQYKTIIIQGYEVITSFLRVLSLIQILYCYIELRYVWCLWFIFIWIFMFHVGMFLKLHALIVRNNINIDDY